MRTVYRRVESFNFTPGTRLLKKYEVIDFLGAGWEGEVYLVNERTTGIRRAAKFFFPHHNVRNKSLRFYARKLERLKRCPIVIQYHTSEEISYEGQSVRFLVSDYVEGQLLSQFLKAQPGQRLAAFEALHLLYALASGMQAIHEKGDYHGDIHLENIIVRRKGLGFDVRLVDMFHWGAPSAANIRDDVVDLVRVFYECLGGQRTYARQPEIVKQICCGLKRSLITRKFRTAEQLRTHLENLEWDE